jgi:hypothetical protein
VTHDSNEKNKPSETSASHTAIRKFLAVVAVNWGADASPEKINLWINRFEKVSVEVLNRAFAYCLDTCKFVPQFADVLEVIHKNNAAIVSLEAEIAWQKLLKFLPWSQRPEFPEKVKQCILAAGGIDYLEQCPLDQLDWARRRFIDTWGMLCGLEQDPSYLPTGETGEILARIRRGLAALPPGKEKAS